MALTMKTGVVWDVETTGLDASSDEVIEIGALKFEWAEDVDEEHGTRSIYQPRVVSLYGGLKDPGRPLPELIKRLTGITDEDVAGKSWDDNILSDFARSAHIHVAHNAGFDSRFIGKLPFFSEATNPTWACSMRHIDWTDKGFKSLALNYLAADHGFVNPFPHRALFDCATTFRLLQPHFLELLGSRSQKQFLICAWGSPFHTKDRLRERKFQWDASLRVWKKEVLESKVEEEKTYLNDHVYGGPHNAMTVEEVVS